MASWHLDQRLRDRQPHNNLVEHGIIPPRGTSGSVFVAARKLQLMKTKDTLNRRISNRPQKKDLMQRNILESGRIDPTLQANSKKLKRLQIVNELKSFIRNRPTPDKLIEDNILQPEFLNNLHINSCPDSQSNKLQNIGRDENFDTSESFRSSPFSDFSEIEQNPVNNPHDRLIVTPDVPYPESDLNENSNTQLSTGPSEHGCVGIDRSVMSNLRNQISTINVGNIPSSNSQYVGIGESPPSQQSLSISSFDSTYSTMDHRHHNDSNVILCQRPRSFSNRDDLSNPIITSNANYYVRHSPNNAETVTLSNQSIHNPSKATNVTLDSINQFSEFSQCHTNAHVNNRSNTLVSRASSGDLHTRKITHTQENGQMNHTSRSRGKKGQKKNQKELKYHFAQGTLIKDHQAKIIFTNEKPKLKKAQSCSSIKTQAPVEISLQSSAILSPNWHNNVTQRIAELKTSVGVADGTDINLLQVAKQSHNQHGNSSKLHEIINTSAGDNSQPSPLDRSEVLPLFFKNTLSDNYLNQLHRDTIVQPNLEGSFNYNENVPKDVIAAREFHSNQDSIQVDFNAENNQCSTTNAASFTLSNDEIYDNEAEFDLETITDGISCDFQREMIEAFNSRLYDGFRMTRHSNIKHYILAVSRLYDQV
ncbi:uncharacterized protein TRIADDRAFT_53059 [Trichoplax adhaerens]|uniref:Uncharacterized protein n=1 Tax=Trichoplax adhaerens TaxID=10228 RepID=B3RN69_TRIAD|nr:hypothetical protein TRIADDRAFT_53059 [Trichoplax adhaerens]EDV27402.1 hypothetical protein TRIADDRAFT_53059 [Trichoplax adhaerens]|eukprot:XP_002109236.1 hypothetical protein TRIADDRAFT_53059 [Trichoplax adhaerens]